MQNNGCRTIGGFIGLENFNGKEYYNQYLRFNLGRNALLYAIRQKGYKKLLIPYYLCECISGALEKETVEYEYYHIDKNFCPLIQREIKPYEVVLIVNYFGCFNDKQIYNFFNQYKNIILDNTQAFYKSWVEEWPVIYTCRKWFGVPDGAYLSGMNPDTEYIRLSDSYVGNRIVHLIRKFENPDEDLYDLYKRTEEENDIEPMKKMALLTQNLLRAVDYDYIKIIRFNNWNILDKMLYKYNSMEIRSTTVPFMYALYTDKACMLREALKKYKIFLPLLWPGILKLPEEWTESKLARNLLLLPVDQRYKEEDMEMLASRVIKELERS